MRFQLIIFFSLMTIFGFGQEVKKEKISKALNAQLKEQNKIIYLKIFNQIEPKLHILPSFDFDDEYLPVLIDFRLNKQDK